MSSQQLQTNELLKLILKILPKFQLSNYVTLYNLYTAKNKEQELINKPELITEIGVILNLVVETTKDEDNTKIFKVLSKYIDSLLNSIENGVIYESLLLSFISIIDKEIKEKSINVFITSNKSSDEKISSDDCVIIMNVFNFINELLELLLELLKEDTQMCNTLLVIQMFIQNIKEHNNTKTKSDKKFNLFLIALLSSFEKYFSKKNSKNIEKDRLLRQKNGNESLETHHNSKSTGKNIKNIKHTHKPSIIENIKNRIYPNNLTVRNLKKVKEVKKVKKVTSPSQFFDV
jgi:hypothetical protein